MDNRKMGVFHNGPLRGLTLGQLQWRDRAIFVRQEDMLIRSAIKIWPIIEDIKSFAFKTTLVVLFVGRIAGSDGGELTGVAKGRGECL